QPFSAPILVTRDFGKTELLRTEILVRGCPTAIEVLAMRASVEYVAGLLHGIDGMGSPAENAENKRYWCFAVNDVKASEGLGTYRLRKGDRLALDLHEWAREDPRASGCTTATP